MGTRPSLPAIFFKIDLTAQFPPRRPSSDRRSAQPGHKKRCQSVMRPGHTLWRMHHLDALTKPSRRSLSSFSPGSPCRFDQPILDSRERRIVERDGLRERCVARCFKVVVSRLETIFFGS